jgi:hypothetical protein
MFDANTFRRTLTMRKLVALLLAAASLSGCVDPAHRSAYSQCVMDNPDPPGLVLFGAIGGAIAGAVATGPGSDRRQCFIDHGVPL